MAFHSPGEAGVNSRPTLILVHGAWHGSWCWERLLAPLAQRALPVRTLDLPSVHGGLGSSGDLSEDAAAIRALIASTDGPLILCGHSYGGMVISLAAASDARVARLVYLCAFMPDAGQSLNAAGGGRVAPWIQVRPDGTTLPDPAQAPELFYGDCDGPTQQWALARLRPQPAAAFAEPVPAPAWQRVASTYILCTLDRCMPLERQQSFAVKAGETLQLEASHSPFLSQPVLLADTLARIAGAAT